MLKKNNYKDESKEDSHFNRDREYRRDILLVCNKKQIDFDTVE